MRAIVATDEAWGIGCHGQLQFHIRADLKRFKELTTGKVIIYGRQTVQTYPSQRPLKNRLNLILSTQMSADEADDAMLLSDLNALAEQLAVLRASGFSEDDFNVVGGTSVYQTLLPYCHEVLRTVVEGVHPADRTFPNLDAHPNWQLVEESPWQTESEYRFRYQVWRNHQYRRLPRLELNTWKQRDAREAVKYDLPKGFPTKATPLNRALKPFQKRPVQILSLTADQQLIGLASFYSDPLLPDGANLSIWPFEPFDDVLMRELAMRFLADRPEFAWLDVRVRPDGAEELGTSARDRVHDYCIDYMDIVNPMTTFVAYAKGWLAITAQNGRIVRIDFLNSGSKIHDPAVERTAQALGILTNDKAILPGKSNVDWSDPRAHLLPVLRETVRQLREYFDGERTMFELPLDLEQGTPFQRSVWHALRDIPYGVTRSYEDIAANVAKPEQQARSLARAVGAACGANPIAIVVPCHRVIGKNLDLIGFAAGVATKAWLLNHELLGYREESTEEQQEHSNAESVTTS